MTSWGRSRRLLALALRPTSVGLFGALAVGLIIRVIGLTWGYPLQFHVDEPIVFGEAVDMAARRSFEPTVFYRPDHVQIKLSFIAYMLYSWGFLQQPVEVAFADDSVTFRLISRSITVVFGLVLIVLAFFVARAIRPGSGVIAAWIFALYPPYVEHSRYITPDVPLAAVTMAAALAMIYYIRQPGLPPLIVTSALTGVAIGIKYPGALITVLIAIVVIWSAVRDRQWWRIVRHGLIAIAATIVSTFLISPVLFANFGQVYGALVSEARLDDSDSPWRENLFAYSSQFVVTAGILMVVLAAVGLWQVVRERREEAIVLSISAVFLFGLIPLGINWERWGTPIWIGPLILSAVGIHSLLRVARGHTSRLVKIGSGAVVVVVALHFMAQNIFERVLPFVLPDSRVWAQDIFEEYGLTSENTVSEGYSPLRVTSSVNIRNRFDEVDGRLVARDRDKQFAVISSKKFTDSFDENPTSPWADRYQQIDKSFPLILDIVPTGIDFHVSAVEPVTIIRALGAIASVSPDTTVGPRLRVYDIWD
jgi:hypothetical protein